MRKKRAFLKIFKIFAIIAAASFAVSVIFAAVCVITIEVKNYNKYDKALMIDIPERGADLHKDTHGGFHGDGETVKMYELSDKEADNLIAEIKISGVWENIDDEALLRTVMTEYRPLKAAFTVFMISKQAGMGSRRTRSFRLIIL